MTDFKPLPTENESYGFWGTSVANGYDLPMAWTATSRVLVEALNLTPKETCDLLDALTFSPLCLQSEIESLVKSSHVWG